MNRTADRAAIQETMKEFAHITGLTPSRTNPRRYLWTDAFAVCNYLELFAQTHDIAYLDTALLLVDQVHHTLGTHRDDDTRRGWISGLDNQEAEAHPTLGGLRIGKKLIERRSNQPPDEHLEWDRDGQYYHYLTKWMHALNCVSQGTGNPIYIRWAMELANIAHSKFLSSPPSGPKRIYWKMSIDLSYPLVSSMGQHDPLDGWITYSELQAAAARYFQGLSLPDLRSEVADMAAICRGINLVTDDPLGIGGLLFDASRIAQLIIQGALEDVHLLETVLRSALVGTKAFVQYGTLEHPADYRLPFRELGLSIGIFAVEYLREWIDENPDLFHDGSFLDHQVDSLLGYIPLREKIDGFWMDEVNRKAYTWIEHQEINMVMLATSLAPARFLTI